MYLNPKNIAFYLFEKGVISWEESLAGVLSYIEAGSRSFGFKVEMTCGKHFFIKQIKNNYDGMSRLLETEALVLQSDTFTDKPTFYLHDKRHGILISSLVNDAQNVGEFVKKEGFSVSIATQLGQILKRFHQAKFTQIYADESNKKQPPLVFYLGSATGRNWIKQRKERYTIQLVEQISLYSSLTKSIEKIYKDWKNEHLIHGDMKFENCLIQSLDNNQTIQLIDFEEVMLGNPLWDVAGIVQSAISVQLQQTHFLIFSPFSPFHPLLDDAPLCEFLEEFWRNYESNDSKKLIQFTGLRLIGRLMEIAQQADVSHHAKEWLPLAQEMIENPEKYLKLIQPQLEK
jgi:thiamine kinase-like enzyme